jgi:hypothetical protein
MKIKMDSCEFLLRLYRIQGLCKDLKESGSDGAGHPQRSLTTAQGKESK